MKKRGDVSLSAVPIVVYVTGLLEGLGGFLKMLLIWLRNTALKGYYPGRSILKALSWD